MAFHHRAPNAVHFFKIMFEWDLRYRKLRIPNKFTMKYGEGLSNPVLLKPPDGTEWKVHWKRHDDEVWFKKGWKEFAQHFSLDHGHLLLFKYEVASHFEVLIFDKSTVEIDYPYHSTHDESESVEKSSDHSVDILGEEHTSQKARPKPTLSSLRPQKKIKTSISGGVERASILQNLHLDVQAKDNQDEGTKFEKQINAELNSSRQQGQEHLGRSILQRASTLRSKNPSFEVRMQPSYVNGRSISIPVEYAKKYLKEGPVLLKVLGRRTWHVTFKIWTKNNIWKYKIQDGWSKFRKENDLKVGDVCVFVLTNSTDISFTILISRAAENPCSSQSKGVKATQRTSLLIRPHPGTTGALKEAEKFTSENPFFKVNIRESDLVSTRPNISRHFCKKYFQNKEQNLMIWFGKKSWPVKLLIYPYRASGNFSAGWSLFVKESKLQAGDVCIFELINREDAVLDVHIFGGHS